jgi:ABC-type nickel/cobalt efflux system permease component RcnA
MSGHLARAGVALTAIAILFLIGATPIFAHPLGNTSVNLYERIQVGAQEFRIRFVLDVAEFPALREKDFSDTNDDGDVDENEATAYLNGFWEYLQPRLILTVDDQALPLTRVSQELTFPEGQGGLQLMRAVYDLSAEQPIQVAGGEATAVLTETTFEGVPGWHEIIVQSGTGVSLLSSTVPETDLTNELTNYPAEMLTAPISVREATFTYRVDQPAASAPPATPTAESPSPEPGPSNPTDGPRPTDPMVALLGQRLDTFSTIVGLFLAAMLGAIHALTPGHGKTLVAAYLVGSRANVSHGLWLGGTVAVTHTAGIFVLGAATLAFTELVVPEQVVSWLAVATGMLIVGLGMIFVWRAQQLRVAMAPAHGGGGRPPRSARGNAKHGHSHGPGQPYHNHDHELTPELKRRDVALLGVVGGLVPSGSALILLLSAIALNEVVYGLLLIVAFGLGMAAVLIGISTGIVFLRRSPVMAWERWRDPRLRPVAEWLPTVSGLVVVALGLFLTLDALRNLR